MLKVESVFIYSSRLFERNSGLRIRMSGFGAFSVYLGLMYLPQLEYPWLWNDDDDMYPIFMWWGSQGTMCERGSGRGKAINEGRALRQYFPVSQCYATSASMRGRWGIRVDPSSLHATFLLEAPELRPPRWVPQGNQSVVRLLERLLGTKDVSI